MKDFVTCSSDGNVKGGMRALLARPGIGGGILVEKVKKAFCKDKEEEEMTSRKRTHSLEDMLPCTQKGRTTYAFDPVQLVGHEASMRSGGSGSGSGDFSGLGNEEEDEDTEGVDAAVLEEWKEIDEVSVSV